MLNHCLIFLILVLCALWPVAVLESVVFNKPNCTDTCGNEILSETDQCILTCVVYLSGFPMESYVTVLLKRTTDRFAREIFSLEPKNDCKRFMKKTSYTCTPINDTVHSISVILNASIDNSEAEITCKLLVPGENISQRKLQILPKIVDYKKTTSMLKINGHNISSENCFIFLPDGNLNFEFHCNRVIAKPCTVEISINESTTILSVVDYIVYNGILDNDILVAIKFGACNLKEFDHVINCTIKTGLNQMTASNALDDWSKSVIGILVVLIILIIFVTAVFCRHKKVHKRWKENAPFEYERLLLQFEANSKPTEEKYEVLYETENGTDDPEAQLKSCENDHSNFKELKSLNKNDINQNADEQLYNLIKAMGNLTVKLKVEVTRTDESTGIDNVTFKTGTGWVDGVFKHNGICKCYNCNQCCEPSTPEVEWRELLVHTSKHLVIDENEVKRTTCEWFDDNDESISSTFKNFVEERQSTECNTILMKYVTCDKNEVKLLDNIRKMHKKWEHLNKKIVKKYKDQKHINNDVFIVFPIHGGKKVVSKGKWTTRVVKSQMKGFFELTRYTYTAHTCPGSTGAYVFMPGRDHNMWTSHHIHCGVDEKGNNFCSFASELT